MLVHIDLPEVAERVHNGWLRTLEEGVHTYDIFTEGISKEKVGTKEFASAVMARLGKKPETFKPVAYAHKRPHAAGAGKTQAVPKIEMVGVDLYVGWSSRNPNELAARLQPVNGDGLTLSIISNRGLKVWPDGMPETFCTDSFRCRFTGKQAGTVVTQHQVISLLRRVADAGFDVVKTESLRNFDGKAGYTLSQGE
jgi:isocitrate dehydrogenase